MTYTLKSYDNAIIITQGKAEDIIQEEWDKLKIKKTNGWVIATKSEENEINNISYVQTKEGIAFVVLSEYKNIENAMGIISTEYPNESEKIKAIISLKQEELIKIYFKNPKQAIKQGKKTINIPLYYP